MFINLNEDFYALTHFKILLEFIIINIFKMEETHNYAMNLIVPLMGIGPLLMLFVFRGDKKTKARKNWTRTTN